MKASTSKRKATAEPKATNKPAKKKAKTRHVSDSDDEYLDQAVEAIDINAHTMPVSFPHSENHHVLSASKQEVIRTALLAWFDTVRDTRGMPWRKPWTSELSAAARSQRAYEVWVSEIMLQQTQVATVIPYFERWMKEFPTVQSLAKASIEDVNAVWKGLGYYTRASRLHAGAKVVVDDYDGIIPSDPAVLEKSIPGIGRYSAGAISSIAYGAQAPVLDGNVHRLLARVLALHANQAAKRTLSILWQAATDLVTVPDTGEQSTPFIPGDLNQALIELGSTVCKPRAPACGECPIRSSCGALALDTKASSNSTDIEDIVVSSSQCTVCEPLPSSGGVTRFPLGKVRKKQREETDGAFVVSWGSWVLLARRPAKGLLGGLWEFPTLPLGSDATSAAVLQAWFEDPESVRVQSERSAGDVLHVFSHIRKTWRVSIVELAISGGSSSISDDLKPPPLKDGAKWVSRDTVEKANLGTGTLKVWQAAVTPSAEQEDTGATAARTSGTRARQVKT